MALFLSAIIVCVQAKELLKFKESKIVALDRDGKVKKIADQLEKSFPTRFKFFNKKFSELDQIVKKQFDTVIFDLGISSLQLDDLSRGFSFKSDSDLDMSMGLTELSAKDAINNLKKDDLKNIIKFFGDEKDAFKIAKNIVERRNVKKLNTTDELVKIIKKDIYHQTIL